MWLVTTIPHLRGEGPPGLTDPAWSRPRSGPRGRSPPPAGSAGSLEDSRSVMSPGWPLGGAQGLLLHLGDPENLVEFYRNTGGVSASVRLSWWPGGLWLAAPAHLQDHGHLQERLSHSPLQHTGPPALLPRALVTKTGCLG